MYTMKPPAVFVAERTVGDAECEARRDRVLAATGADGFEVVRDEDIPAMIQRPEWQAVQGKAGERDAIHDPILFFTRFVFDDAFGARCEAIAEAHPGFGAAGMHRAMLGYNHFNWFNSGQAIEQIKPCPDHVCRPAWRLNTAHGCAHRCFYCGLVGFIVVGLNMSEYIRRLDRLVEANPWQQTWLWDDVADVLILEPELGAFADMAHYFAGRPDRYLIIHTKSANVDFLESLDHRGHTIMCWSLAAETQAGRLEQVAGTTGERIEAARRCQGWGYPVRFKFKPIVPVRGWRDEARAMIRMMFERTRPDNLSMTTLAWMSYDDLARIIDLDRLDPVFVEAARRDKDVETKLPRLRPFPHEVRREIYKFYIDEIRAIDADVPLTLSTESLAMWRDLGPRLGVRPDTYTCGCGPQAVPGLRCLPESPWKVARPVAAWKDPD